MSSDSKPISFYNAKPTSLLRLNHAHKILPQRRCRRQCLPEIHSHPQCQRKAKKTQTTLPERWQQWAECQLQMGCNPHFCSAMFSGPPSDSRVPTHTDPITSMLQQAEGQAKLSGHKIRHTGKHQLSLEGKDQQSVATQNQTHKSHNLKI